jgi:hypothetical protein
VTGEALLGEIMRIPLMNLSSDYVHLQGLSKVLRTRTTIGGPNTLGGSVTAGIGAKPIFSDIT